MPNQVRVGVGVDGVPKAKSELDSFRGKFRQTTADIQKAGKEGGFAFGAAAGIAAKGVDLIGNAAFGAGQAIGSFVHDSIAAASDLNETISKAHVVFGSAADDIEKWGKTAARSMGLSENAALGAAASIGNLLLSTGTAPEKIAPMSKGIVQLASDLASFNNIPIEDALAKLQSGLVGQERPLRELGVAISAASVDAEAAALGFHKVNGEFSEGEKVQARYSLIFKQTATAQGDFARTSDQLANSQRIANAQQEDLQATLGKKMLPAQLAVTKAQINFFQGLNDIADGIGGNVTPRMLELADSEGKLGAIADGVRGKIHELSDEALDSAHGYGIFTDAAYNAERQLRGTDEATNKAKASYQALGDSLLAVADRGGRASGRLVAANGSIVGSEADVAKAATDAAAKFKAASDRMITAALNAKKSLLTDAQDTVDNYFGVLITQDKLLDTQAEISKNKRILASAKATAAEKHDAREALHQLGADEATYLQDLAKAGASGSKLFTKNMEGLLTRLGHAHGAERKQIAAEILALEILASTAYNAAQKVKSATNGGNVSSYGGGRAGGGPVSAGKTYDVGESGREKLTMFPGGGGMVTPEGSGSAPATSAPSSGGGSSGGGGTIVVAVPMNWTPSQQQAFAREATPHIAREMQRQGLL